ncbi:Protein of unknown function DUF3995, partial [Klenkia terrae]
VNRPAWRWPGWASAVVGGLFALLSFAWGLGSTVGISSLGGRIEELAREGDPTVLALAWVTGLAKAVGAALGVVLATCPGRLPRRWLLRTAWAGAAVLVLYGLAQQVGVLLVLTGAVTPTTPPADGVLLTRALLWEPWFWVWGLLLGLAAWCAPAVWDRR